MPRRGGTTRVTIRDVARRAGVSVGAASTALSNTNTNVALSQQTRERVLAAARELRYRPMAAARAMAGKTTQVLGVLATKHCMTATFYANVFRAIASEAEDCGSTLLVKIVKDADSMLASTVFTERQVDGVIIPGDAEKRTGDALRHFAIPHVWVNTELTDSCNCVHVDDAQGSRLAVDHLVELGHRRIGFVYRGSAKVHHVMRKRHGGYAAGLRAHGLPFPETHDADLDVAEHVRLYLGQRDRPTALVVCSDAMAILASHELLRQGLRIPEDMSVVGHEGVVLHDFAYRPLTTVVSPVDALGRTAVRMLVQQLETGDAVPSAVLPESLRVSASTASPAA
jgi:LacI family transcriptional regulator